MLRTTRIFLNGNFWTIRIPAELAHEGIDSELEIERIGEEIRIRLAKKPLSGVPGKFARLGKDCVGEGRAGEEQADRDAL